MPILVNKQLELEKTKEYRLSIQADLNGFSFSVINHRAKKVHYLWSSDFSPVKLDSDGYLKEIKSTVEEIPLLSAAFDSVRYITDSHKFVTVPLPLFKEEDAHLYLKALHTIEDGEEIDFFTIPDIDMAIVFATDSSIINCIKIAQSEFRILPSVALPLCYLPRMEGHNKIYLGYHKGDLKIVAAEGGKILYCNSFNALHFNTVLYFAMMVVKQVMFNPEHTTIYVHGNFGLSDLSDLAKYFSKIKYFRNQEISMGDGSAELRYSMLAFE